jgi:hypothetical protein
MDSKKRMMLWSRALRDPTVRRCALMVGTPVGFLQIAINQGDNWLRLAVDATLITKTLLTPVVAIGVALVSAAGARLEKFAVEEQR